MKKLPIGIQSIEKILGKGDYIYVDKTLFALQLIEGDAPHYFFSRPRRFGKSLFLSTLEEIFKGNKALFKDCKIYDSDYEWPVHPVLSLNFAEILNETTQDLKDSLRRSLAELAAEHETKIELPSVQEGIKNLIKALYREKRVVVLVDEYDKPIIDHLHNPAVAESNRQLLQSFFGALKNLDKYVRFTFVTGISKFSQVSLFSGANHLDDITMDPHHASMMGYTEEELLQYFDHHLLAVTEERNAQGQSITEKDVLAEIKQWYNGYRFSKADTYVYNPFSTLKFLGARAPKSYWYATGTPSFLIEQVSKHPQVVPPLAGIVAEESALMDISSLEEIDLKALMFQTGYLTIQAYQTGNEEEEGAYTLDFPNREVRRAFFASLLKEFARIDPQGVTRAAKQLREDLTTYNLEAFIKTINIHLAKIPYYVSQDAKEGFYQAVFFTLLEKSGIRTQAEVPTNIGRIDLVAQLPAATVIFELKRDQTATLALDQARCKEYCMRYVQPGKELLVMGINFSSATRNIDSWQGELLDERGERVRVLRPIPA
ncbi:MAG: AAA family ATPase [Roseivirga sp.]